jgi:flagellar hook assembly protein FlgD
VWASPNPFNPATAINYKLQTASHISLKVYDTAGRQVATLAEGWKEAGDHQATFDGSNLTSGVYLYRLEAGAQTATGKMVLMK